MKPIWRDVVIEQRWNRKQRRSTHHLRNIWELRNRPSHSRGNPAGVFSHTHEAHRRAGFTDPVERDRLPASSGYGYGGSSSNSTRAQAHASATNRDRLYDRATDRMFNPSSGWVLNLTSYRPQLHDPTSPYHRVVREKSRAYPSSLSLAASSPHVASLPDCRRRPPSPRATG